MIQAKRAASFVVQLTDTSRDPCNQYNATLCVLYKIENNNRQELTAKEKGKILIFFLFFSAKIFTYVGKLYLVAVYVKTSPNDRSCAFEIVFEVATLRR